MSRDLNFLWNEGALWHAQTPSGSIGTGSSRETALASLPASLHEERRSRRQTKAARPPVDPRASDTILDRSAAPDARPTVADRERAEIEEIESIGLADCLFVSPSAFAAQLDALCTRRPRGIPLDLGEDRAIISISEHPITASLRQSRVLWITSGCYSLEIDSHWVPGSTGLFAFDGARLSALHGRPENLRALIEAEQPDFDDADPTAWASLVAESIGRDGPASHSLTTIEDLERLDATREYVLDRRELTRIAPLVPATIESSAEGWTLRFTTAFGLSGMELAIYAWQVTVCRRFKTDIRVDLLSGRIFLEVPLVMA